MATVGQKVRPELDFNQRVKFDRAEQLMEEEHDVNQRDSKNVTLLCWAAINNRLEIAKYILAKDANPP